MIASFFSSLCPGECATLKLKAQSGDLTCSCTSTSTWHSCETKSGHFAFMLLRTAPRNCLMCLRFATRALCKPITTTNSPDPRATASAHCSTSAASRTSSAAFRSGLILSIRRPWSGQAVHAMQRDCLADVAETAAWVALQAQHVHIDQSGDIGSAHQLQDCFIMALGQLQRSSCWTPKLAPCDLARHGASNCTASVHEGRRPRCSGLPLLPAAVASVKSQYRVDMMCCAAVEAAASAATPAELDALQRPQWDTGAASRWVMMNSCCSYHRPQLMSTVDLSFPDRSGPACLLVQVCAETSQRLRLLVLTVPSPYPCRTGNHCRTI